MTREEVIDIHMLLATFRCFHEQLYTMKGKHTKTLKMKFKRLIGVARAYENEILKLNNNQDDLDTIYDAMMELINEAKQLRNFAIISSISDNKEFPNFSIKKKRHIDYKKNFEVDSVDGYCMLINKKRIKSMFKDDIFFDEKIFMYLENDDLCKRVKENNEKIFIVPTSKIKHLGARGVSNIFHREVELSRNWHWSWSKFYFSKKHKGYFYALVEGLPKLVSSTIKFFFYYIIFKKFKSKVYYNRTLGLFNSMLNRSSWYRPK